MEQVGAPTCSDGARQRPVDPCSSGILPCKTPEIPCWECGNFGPARMKTLVSVGVAKAQIRRNCVGKGSSLLFSLMAGKTGPAQGQRHTSGMAVENGRENAGECHGNGGFGERQLRLRSGYAPVMSGEFTTPDPHAIFCETEWWVQ